jgi:hypothetical protein
MAVLVALASLRSAHADSSASEAQSPPRGLHALPQGLVGVSFRGLESARIEPMSLAAAKERMNRAQRSRADHGAEEGHEQWFFHAFDKESLYFFVGRFHVRCQALGCMEYVADRIYRVPRAPEAERALGAQHTVELWESGIRGVRGGMSAKEVEAVLGKPESTRPQQYVGSFTWSYPGLEVTFLAGRVAFAQEASK